MVPSKPQEIRNRGAPSGEDEEERKQRGAGGRGEGPAAHCASVVVSELSLVETSIFFKNHFFFPFFTVFSSHSETWCKLSHSDFFLLLLFLAVMSL